MSDIPKKAADHIPYCQDQGMDYLAGAGKAGVSMQSGQSIAAAGALLFADLDMVDMADTNYEVYAQNDTDQTRTATISSKTTAGFTTTGPSASDVQSYLVVGRVAGQTSAA